MLPAWVMPRAKRVKIVNTASIVLKTAVLAACAKNKNKGSTL
jgi:hypothetical protein